MVTRALKGVRVVDLTRMLPGPYASMILADLGAEVIKVEDTGSGDPTRWSARHTTGSSSTFAAVNRGKRSLALDLKAPDGVELFRRLVRTADVVLEGFRPGVMDRLGIGFSALAELQPRIVYCSISGYGSDGPYRERGGHDVNYLALAGVLGLQTDAAGNPVLSGIQVADLGGALFAVIGTLAALAGRERTGRGACVDVSMMDVGIALLPVAAARLFAGGEVPLGARLPLSGRMACYNVYRTADGRHLSVGALEEKFWQRFCRVVGRDDFIARQTDPVQEDVIAAVSAIIAGSPLADWVERFRDVDACVEPVLSVEEALEQPQARHRRMVFELENPAGGATRQLNLPFRFEGCAPERATPPPGHGEHTREILASIGYSEAEIGDFVVRRVVTSP